MQNKSEKELVDDFPSSEAKEDLFMREMLLKDCKELISVRLDYKFNDKTLPIHNASLYNSLTFFTRLDLPQIQINLPGGEYNSTPLMFTVYNSNHKVSLFLLLNGADPLMTNASSLDALNLCVRFDDLYGLILMLSFIDGEINLSRYVRYANLKQKGGLHDWLLKFKNEEAVEEKKPKEKGLSMLNMVLYFIVCIVVGGAIWSSIWRLFVASFFALTFIGFIATPVYLFFNLFYSFYAYTTIVFYENSCFYDFIIIFMHFLFIFILLFMQNTHKNKNKLSETRPIVTNLILEDNYTHKTFCYTCLNVKGTAKHCRICDVCVINHSHHCPFFNKCISETLVPYFFGFVFFSMLLYALAIVKSSTKLSKFEFLSCFTASLGSLCSFVYRRRMSPSEEDD